MKRSNIFKFKNNSNIDKMKIFKMVVILLVSIILIYEFKGEIKGLNFPETLKVLRSLENITIIAMFILGIIAISFTTLYDFVVNSYFTLGLPFKKVLKISWISNSINNFIGLGRLVGASLRTFFYEKEGIEKKTAIKANIYIVFSNITGLSLLIILGFLNLYDFSTLLGDNGFYYIIPWIFSMLIFISELRIDRDKNKSQNPKLANEYSTKALSALVFFAGTVLVLSAAIPALAKRFKIVRKFISIPILQFSKRSSMAIGIMLLILSKGIYDKVKTAYKSTIILLILGALLTFVKGLDFEEAIILIIISLLLFLSKDSFLDELKEISDEWLGPREEKGFSIGWFDREYLNRSPIAIIRHDNKVIAFANLMPLYDDETMSIDLMRSNNNIPSGTMDALFIELMEWSKAQGYNKFNLGMAPLSNVGVNPYSANLEKLIKNLYQRGNKIYSFSGLRKYKEKFQPRWESRYLAYPKDANISMLLLQIVMLTSKSRKI